MECFRLGDRVEEQSIFMGAVRAGTQGTVALVAGFRGKSIYCDPSRLMIFVEWDNGVRSSEFKRFLKKITGP